MALREFTDRQARMVSAFLGLVLAFGGRARARRGQMAIWVLDGFDQTYGT